jgi:heme/copper-type cytochrome/quinol oxidase subunit 2
VTSYANLLYRSVLLAAPFLSPTNIFAPASTPAQSILDLFLFVLEVTAAVFLVVFTLLTYAVVKFRKRKTSDGREPAQVYGSSHLELAWTVVPVLIVVVLFLAAARVIASIQNAPKRTGGNGLAPGPNRVNSRRELLADSCGYRAAIPIIRVRRSPDFTVAGFFRTVSSDLSKSDRSYLP